VTYAVICTPLRVEQAALHGAVSAQILCTGRGPAVRVDTRGPVAVAGIASALADGISPGELVVGSEFRDAGGEIEPSNAAPLLFSAVRRLGLPVQLGPLSSQERRSDGGALAIDAESVYLARQAPPGQTVSIRAIADPANALTALRALRSAAPAIDQWAAATGARELVLASPRSFCAGVERAVNIVERALQRYGPPIYVRRQIVHNSSVVDDLERRGAVFVAEVDEVPSGSVVVFSAHGVTPEVHGEASARGLRAIDATCPLVAKVHMEVRRFAAKGHTVFLIGHADHEEVVGTRGEAPTNVIVVADPDAASRVQPADPDRVAYVTQTTLATEEVNVTADVLRQRFPALAAPPHEDICYATTNRQVAIRSVAHQSDLMLVVGSQNSSNSQRLVEVAERSGTPAHLVDRATDVDLRWLAGAQRVGITAGASAPPYLVDEVVHALSGLGPTTVSEVKVADEDIEFTMPREVG
jgi:4-hydroxy-3-methylbut-2-en-1-yl diphosphate reductase